MLIHNLDSLITVINFTLVLHSAVMELTYLVTVTIMKFLKTGKTFLRRKISTK